MRRKLKLIFGVCVTLVLLSIPTFACTCSYDGIKAKGVSGQVFGISHGERKPDFNQALPQATVKLLIQTADDQKIVAEGTADKDGRFSLENIKPGKYFLKIQSEGFSSVFVPIRVSKLSGKKDQIIIALAPGLQCCEGYAGVQKSR